MTNLPSSPGAHTAYDIDNMNENAIRVAYMEASALKRRLEETGAGGEELRSLRDAVWQLRAAHMASIAEALARNDGEVGHLRDQLGDAAAAIREADADMRKIEDTLKKVEKAANLAIKLLSAAVT